MRSKVWVGVGCEVERWCMVYRCAVRCGAVYGVESGGVRAVHWSGTFSRVVDRASRGLSIKCVCLRMRQD